MTINLVKMQRSEPTRPGGPTSADVHPLEVDAWRCAGWEVAAEDKTEKTEKTPEVLAEPKPKRERKPKQVETQAPVE